MPMQICPAVQGVHIGPQWAGSSFAAHVAVGPVPHLCNPGRQVIPQANIPPVVASQIRVGPAPGGRTFVHVVHAPPQLVRASFGTQRGGSATVPAPHEWVPIGQVTTHAVPLHVTLPGLPAARSTQGVQLAPQVAGLVFARQMGFVGVPPQL